MLDKRRANLALLSLMAFLALSPCPTTSHAQGLDWAGVSEHGFGESENWWVGMLHAFEGSLYAGTWNPNGAQIWRSADGEHWFQVVSDGLGDARNQGIMAACTFHDQMYVGVYNARSGAAIWSSSDGVTWETMQERGLGDESNGSVLSMAEFDGALYAGTWNFSGGAQVWRTTDGVLWEQAQENGFGNPSNEQVGSAIVYQDALYVGTYNQATGAEIWRTSDGLEWKQVVTNGLKDEHNVQVSTMVIHDGALYAGTQNDISGSQVWRTRDGFFWTPLSGLPRAMEWNCLVSYEGALFAFGTGDQGTEAWFSRDAKTWNSSTVGFGDASNKSTLAAVSYAQALYAATSNPTKGGGVFRTNGYGTNVTASAAGGTPCAEDNQVYNFILENCGLRPLTRVMLNTTLPAEIGFLPGVSSDHAKQDIDAGTVSWDLGTLLPTESITVHAVARVVAPIERDTLITVRARVEATGTLPFETQIDTVLLACRTATALPEGTDTPRSTGKASASDVGPSVLAGPSRPSNGEPQQAPGAARSQGPPRGALLLPLILKGLPAD